MKPRTVVGFHVGALELQSIFKMAAKFTLKLTILPVNQHYYEQNTVNKKRKQSVCDIAFIFTLIYFRTILFYLELQSMFKIAAKFPITLTILPDNQHYYRLKKLIKNKKYCGGNIALAYVKTIFFLSWINSGVVKKTF